MNLDKSASIIPKNKAIAVNIMKGQLLKETMITVPLWLVMLFQ